MPTSAAASRSPALGATTLYGGPGPASEEPNPPHPVDARRMRDSASQWGPTVVCTWAWRCGGHASRARNRNAEDFAFARELELPISLHVGRGRHRRRRSRPSTGSVCSAPM